MASVDLSLDTLSRTIIYKGVEKHITDEYWDQEINSILFPLWSTDKDRLELFVKKKDGTFLIIKNRYIKNHKTGQYKWVTVEDNSDTVYSEQIELYNQLVDKFLEYKGVDNKKLETILRREYSKSTMLSWGKVAMLIKFLLRDCDWTQIVDSGISNADKALWKKYRKKLREIPSRYARYRPDSIKWPITPSKHKKLNDGSVYLEDSYGHYYQLNENIIAGLTERIIHYFTIVVSTKLIDEEDLEFLTRPQALVSVQNDIDISLDDLISYISLPEEPSLDDIIGQFTE